MENVEGKEEKRIIFIDYLNVASCIAVIALHCNGCFWSFSHAAYWKSAVFIECLFYWAVPCFFMITGATLIDYRKKYNTEIYFKKRFQRTVIPFLFWSIVWLIGKKMYVGKSFLQIVELIIMTRPIGIFYFFIALFSVYFSIPILGLIEEKKRKFAYSYMTILAFATISLLPFISTLLHIGFNWNITTGISGGYLLYVLLGYLLVNNYVLNFRSRCLVYILGSLGLISRVLTVYFWSIEAGKIDNTFGEYLNVPTVFFAIAIFTFFQYDFIHIVRPSFVVNNVVKKLSLYSLGVYIVHITFVIKIPIWLHFSSTSLVWRTFGVLLVYGVSLLVVYLIKKIPYLKGTLP